MGSSSRLIVNKLKLQAIVSEFDSYWVPILLALE